MTARAAATVSPPASATPVAPAVGDERSARRRRSVRSSPPASRTMPASASTSLTPPPSGTGIPPSWSAQAITWVMNPETASPGRARVQHPGREQPVRLPATEGRRGPVAAASRARGPRTRAGHGGRSGAAPWPRPSPAPDHSSVPRTPKLRSALAMNSSNCRCHAAPSPAAWRSNSATFASSDVSGRRRRPVRERRRGRELGVEVLEPAPAELVSELTVGGGAGEERVPGAITSCVKPGSV